VAAALDQEKAKEKRGNAEAGLCGEENSEGNGNLMREIPKWLGGGLVLGAKALAWRGRAATGGGDQPRKKKMI